MIVYIFLALLVVIITWRIILPNMNLAPKAKADNGILSVDSPAGKTTTLRSITDRAKEKWLSILFLIAGIVVFYFGVYNSSWKPPHITHIGTWAYGCWFWILVLWGILAALIAFNTKLFEKTSGILQTIMAIIIFMLFIGFPVIGWFANPSKSAGRCMVPMQTQASIPLASAPQSSWPKLAIPAGGKSELPRAPSGMHTIVKGYGADLHTVYKDGHECVIPIESDESSPDGPIAGVYVTNKENEMNIISYAYSK